MMALCASLSCWADSGGDDVAARVRHRREVRRALANASTRDVALTAALKDSDPAVRRYASFIQTGRDPGRPANGRKLHRTNVPLSQDPANDHEVSSVQSVRAVKGAFTLPAKPEGTDGLELWFAPLPEADVDLQFWLNGVYLGQFHRAAPGDGQEFRLNASAEAVWGGKNGLVIKNGAGQEVIRPFTAEVVKCGH